MYTQQVRQNRFDFKTRTLLYSQAHYLLLAVLHIFTEVYAHIYVIFIHKLNHICV